MLSRHTAITPFLSYINARMHVCTYQINKIQTNLDCFITYKTMLLSELNDINEMWNAK